VIPNVPANSGDNPVNHNNSTDKVASTSSPETTTPTISIAGRDWPVPQLSPKQNRIVVPALLDVFPKIIRARDAAQEAGDLGGLAQLARYLDTAVYDLLTDISFHALTRAHPELKRGDFDELPIDTAELIAAIGVVACQAGLFKPDDTSNA
jgi:hypothetical protein